VVFDEKYHNNTTTPVAVDAFLGCIVVVYGIEYQCLIQKMHFVLFLWCMLALVNTN
jgi:hypothetical protein